MLKAEVVVSMNQDFLWVGLPQFPGMSLFFLIQRHVEIIPYHTLVALPNPRVKPDVPLVGHRSSSDSTGGVRDLVGLG